MAALDEWVTVACRELGLDAAAGQAAGQDDPAVDPAAQTQLVLDLAREVAHGVARPAAPVTAFLLGVAVGRGADPAEAAASLTRLAADWPG